VIPTLARRGRLVLASGVSFTLIGAFHAAAPMVALGTCVLSALLSFYLAFFPTAILLRRRKIELSWWVPPGDQPGGALAANRPFSLHVALRNHSERRLRVLQVNLLAPPGLAVPDDLEAVVRPGQQVELCGELCAHAAGYFVLHGAVLVFGDALGLFDVRAYFPNPIAVKVFPREAALAGAHTALRLRGGPLHERMGPHQIRRRGVAGELREIRDAVAGDPFKLIAWKATARRQKLMVRDLDTEVVITHQILVDIAGSMRGGPPGGSKLDYAIETAAALARSSLAGGDRVGLVTFDSRVYSQLRPADGYHHYLQVIDRLLETRNIVDEDLTDLTNSELVAAVARYLAHQEAVDVRLPRAPALDDPAWATLHAGPTGELYDLAAMGAIVATLLRAFSHTERKSLAPAWWWSRVHIGAASDPQMARLRLFCRLRGIELPYRPDHERGARAGGLADAIAAAASGERADVLVLISDLFGLLEGAAAPLGSLALAKRNGLRVIVLAPFGPSFLPVPNTLGGERVADAAGRAEALELARARRVLDSHGIPTRSAGPGDTGAVLARRIARAGGALRRVA
jgi:uncharacterized protein (DUF58 family)